ncbi:MAG: TonB-dependent receptor [Thermodesulfobacteriota bacterium]|nr:TonB-dependent receptor [Thermodesulfobacteriota bacterium]
MDRQSFKIKFTIIIFSLLVALPCALAQNRTAIIDDITVTAEQSPVSEIDSSRFVSIISAEDLKETGASNLVQALKKKGGFVYEAFGPLGISHGGMNSKLSIRGIEDGELVLINGSPIQGAAGGAYDLSSIPVDQIERVEILKGAASTLYGADAMTGVINIITKKDIKEAKSSFSTQWGDFGYQNHTADFQNPLVNLGLNYQHLDGINEVSRSFTKKYRYDTKNSDLYSFNLNLRPIKNLFVDYLGSYSETGFNKIKDSGELSKGTDQEQTKHFTNIRYQGDAVRLSTFANFDTMERDEYTDPTEPDNHNKNNNYGLKGDYRYSFMDTDLNIGAEYVYRMADYNNQYNRHYREDYALFVQIKKEIAKKFNITLGAREQLIEADSDSTDQNIFLPSVGMTYKVKEAFNIFANAGKAFKAPSFNNLYYSSSFLVGNKNLDPEEGWTYETGIKTNTSFFSLRLALFAMEYKDKIEIDRSKGYPLTYYNAGDYETKGVEWDLKVYPLQARADFLSNIIFTFAGYLADPEADDPEGHTVQAGAKFSAGAGVSYITQELELAATADFIANRERALDDNSPVNFCGKVKLPKGYLTFAVENIFDEEVQVSGDMESESSNNYLYYEIPRQIKIGYELTF